MLKILFMTTLILNFAYAKEDGNFKPVNILHQDDLFSPYVLVAEKTTHLLYVFENSDGDPHLLKTFRMATGKSMGNKQNTGDFKTPEGVYRMLNYFSKEDLEKKFGKEAKQYGSGAFTLDYPNELDRREGKTGSGIWLHSTDNNARIDEGLASKGCVVVTDAELKEISRYVRPGHTPLVIVQDLYYLPENSWKNTKDGILQAVEKWRKNWESEDLDQYISVYHPREFRSSHGGFNGYKEYKRSVFNNPGKPKIVFPHVSSVFFGNYALVQVEQQYTSSTINDTGKKILYMKRDDDYKWKIISEDWKKLTDNPMEISSLSLPQ